MASTRQVEYKDRQGQLFLVEIPNDAPESHAQYGVAVGPPSLDALNLPKDARIRLNNALYHRRLFTERDVRRRPNDVFAALQAALRVDVTTVTGLYLANNKESK